MGYDKFGLNWNVTARGGSSSKKASTPWHDINDPGVVAANQREEEAQAQPVEEESAAQEQPKKQEEPEVELLSADLWEPGEKGYLFNNECYLTVKAQFLKKTIRKRLQADVFAEYDGQEEDLKQPVEAFMEDDGTAKFKIMLYFSDETYKKADEKPEVSCKFYLKNIRHSLGKNTLESTKIEAQLQEFRYSM